MKLSGFHELNCTFPKLYNSRTYAQSQDLIQSSGTSYKVPAPHSKYKKRLEVSQTLSFKAFVN